MSQMPDKIWLHKYTKYNTGDIVCGYQYVFAEGIEDEGGIENFVEYVPFDTFIEKACEWLKENACNYASTAAYSTVVNYDEEFLIEDFKKYMEGKDEVREM